MTIAATTNRVSYTGAGTAGPFGFAYPLQNLANLSAAVQNIATGAITPLAQNTDFTLSGTLVANFGYPAGVNLTLLGTSPLVGTILGVGGTLPSTYTIVLFRNAPATQGTSIPQSGPLPSKPIEASLDLLALSIQRSLDLSNRAFKLADGFNKTFDTTLPSTLDLNPGTALIVNPAGNAFIVGPTADQITNAQTYANNSATSATASAGSASSSASSATLASLWAAQFNGTVVNFTDYSSKEYAIGTPGTSGSAKDWAQKTASAIAAGLYSAKVWAVDSSSIIRGIANGGSAKDWATYLGGTVDDTLFSAKKYANDAATSATAAQTAVNSAMFRDVVFKTFADSPITLDNTYRGKLVVIDSSSGAVVVNLPSIATLDLTTAFTVGIKKESSDSNSITINRASTDLIDSATSVSISTPSAGVTLIPDKDPSPFQWTGVQFGATAGNLSVDTFTGDGSTVAFTLSVSPGSKNNTFVSVGGVLQAKAGYSLAGSALTFTEAPPSGAAIEVISGTTLSIGVPSDSTVSRAKMVAGGIAPTVQTAIKTANYTITTSDDVIRVNGVSGVFNITLPTAVGAQGRKYKVIRTDTTLANQITINTTSSQTIGYNGVTSIKICTQGEMFEFESDGSNWIISDRFIPSKWVDSGPCTIGGSTTAPTKGTVTVDRLLWKRIGDSMHLRYQYKQTAAGAAGSGAYQYGLPSGAALDTNKVTLYGPGTVTDDNFTNNFGHFGGADRTNGYIINGQVYAATTTSLSGYALEAKEAGTGYAGGLVGNGGFASLNTATIIYAFSAIVPISGWEE